MAHKAAAIEFDVKPELLPNDNFRVALLFWESCRGGAELPPHAKINPSQLPRALVANFSVISVEEGGESFHYRIIGSAVVRGWGENITGRHVDDLPGGAEMAERMRACVQSRRPYYSQGPLKFAVNNFRSFAVLVMPFCDEAGEVARLLVYNEFA